MVIHNVKPTYHIDRRKIDPVVDKLLLKFRERLRGKEREKMRQGRERQSQRENEKQTDRHR